MLLSYGHEPEPAAVRALGPDHLTITLHIGTEDAAALGMESGIVSSWFVTALRSLAALRTGQVDREDEAGHIHRGPATVDTWYWAINDLETHLLPALKGIRDAAIRAHHAAGGSVGNLALAMGVEARSTAQSRRDVVVSADPSERESWACQHAGEYARTRSDQAPRRKLTEEELKAAAERIVSGQATEEDRRLAAEGGIV